MYGMGQEQRKSEKRLSKTSRDPGATRENGASVDSPGGTNRRGWGAHSAHRPRAKRERGRRRDLTLHGPAELSDTTNRKLPQSGTWDCGLMALFLSGPVLCTWQSAGEPRGVWVGMTHIQSSPEVRYRESEKRRKIWRINKKSK